MSKLDMDVSSYLELDGLDAEARAGAAELQFELELGFADDSDRDLEASHVTMYAGCGVIHTRPIDLVNVQQLRSLQTSFEEQEELQVSYSPSLAHTRHSSVFSSTKSINALLEEDLEREEDLLEAGLDFDFECLPPPAKKRALVGPALLPSSIARSEYRARDHEKKTSTDLASAAAAAAATNQFVLTVTNKLSPYFGYFLADSDDLDYVDKIRFQEIDYKFSKTYF